MSEAQFAQEREIKKLKAENASLRKELETEHVLAEALGHSHELAQAENEKLRELIRDIYVQYDDTLDWVEIERRMSELGIEVK
jgi:hypothetical protein